jgi:hypothetical protein
MPDPHSPSTLAEDARTRWLAVLSFLLLPLPFVMAFTRPSSTGFVALSLLPLVLSWWTGVRYFRAAARRGQSFSFVKLVFGVLLFAVGLAAPGMGYLTLFAIAFGGAWGRPLRVRGRQLHPELRLGADWTEGARPDATALDPATRRALEALWLHDAQKEHASVPAFARVSWLLAAVGAPADLLAGSHRAALEEIDHAQRCFALAAGYGGRSHTVEPMPDLLQGGASPSGRARRGDPRVLLALESLRDGCLLEDYNADVAAACAAVCEEPATNDVLQRIAREERSHADFSWAVLRWTLEVAGEPVQRALAEEVEHLGRVARPTAVSSDKQALVAAADPSILRAHGRLPDHEWADLWTLRLAATSRRARALLDGSRDGDLARLPQPVAA